MEIITKKRYELEVQLDGESHTLCNVLRKNLMEMDDVKAAAYDPGHPIVGEPVLYIRGKKPKELLKQSAETLKEDCAEFKELLEKNL